MTEPALDPAPPAAPPAPADPTPEDRAELERRAAEVRARRAALTAAESAREAAERSEFQRTLERILGRARAEAEHRSGLPCFGRQQAGAIGAAVDACEAAGAARTCRYAAESDCPRQLEAAPRAQAEERLREARVPDDPALRLLAAMPRRLHTGARPAEPLLPTDALRLVRTFLARRAQDVAIDCSPEPVNLLGHERLLVLGGDVGVGKTLAAGWAVREHGRALWLHAQEFEFTGAEGDKSARDERQRLRARAETCSLLVLDELGEERVGATRYAADEIATLLAKRLRSLDLLTIATTNMERADARERYGARLDDRIHGAGRWVGLEGPSLRGAR